VENSGSGNTSAAAGTGVGLENVRRRIEICYGSASELALSITPETCTVELRLPLGRPAISRHG
jgi:LytS/YehU family sensor histidine kinase